jgi:hypothetical protein
LNREGREERGEDKGHLLRRLAFAVAVIVFGGLGLTVVNLLLPKASIFIAVVAGLLAFFRVFFVPGQITWRRDFALWGVVLLTLIVAEYGRSIACSSLPNPYFLCERNQQRADTFLNVFCLASPVFLFWSYIRFRHLKYRLSGKAEEESFTL